MLLARFKWLDFGAKSWYNRLVKSSQESCFLVWKTEAPVSLDRWEVEMAKEFSLTIEQDEEGHWVAIVPELQGYRVQAESLEELMSKLKEVLESCLKSEEEW